MKELVQLQKDLHDLAKNIVSLTHRVEDLEDKVNKDISIIRKEAKEVLEKASALVNPYSPNTMTFGNPGGTK